jgi:hypothetical protein
MVWKASQAKSEGARGVRWFKVHFWLCARDYLVRRDGKNEL